MTAFWAKLAKREKYAVSAAAIIFVVFIFWAAIISPFLNHRDKTAKAIRAKSAIVREMRELQEKYRSLSGKANQVSKTGESIFSFVEKTAGETGLKENLTSVNPSETTDPLTGKKKNRVDVRFQSIDTNQLVLFLHKIETTGHGVVENITVTRSAGNKAFLNTNMLIVSN